LVRVDSAEDDDRDWTSADFARLFLGWLTHEYPATRGGSIRVSDIEKHLFPRFQKVAGCIHLQVGSMLRGLGSVTEKQEIHLTDHTGRRRLVTAYVFPHRNSTLSTGGGVRPGSTRCSSRS
jgi:hypothetical protein